MLGKKKSSVFAVAALAPLTTDEVIAAKKILNFFRRVMLRKRFIRLVRFVITKERIKGRADVAKETMQRRRAALVIYRAWKNSKSLRMVVKTAMVRKEELTRQDKKDFFSYGGPFPSPTELGSAQHVDWRDLTATRNQMFSKVQNLGETALDDRLKDILGLENSIFEDQDMNMSESMKELQRLDERCFSCSSPNKSVHACPKCRKPCCSSCSVRVFCLMCTKADAQTTVTVPEDTPRIDACTMDALAFFLTNPNYIARFDLQATLFATIQSWAPTPMDRQRFIRSLRLRFMSQDKADVKAEVLNCLTQWLQVDDTYAMSDLVTFVSDFTSLVDENDRFCAELVQLFKEAGGYGHRHQVVDVSAYMNSAKSIQPCILPPAKNRPWKVPIIPQLELARQLTLIEFETFSSIGSGEFLDNAWNSKRKEILAPNILLLTGRFNRVSDWVSRLILAETAPIDRAHLIQYFIIVERHLFNLNNFNGVFEVHAALSSSHIARLQTSWKLVAPAELLSFARVDGLISPANNYREYRKLLQASRPGPCIPYIGAWLTDLTFLGEQKNWITREEEQLPPMVNVAKLSKVWNILSIVKEFQSHPFPLECNAEISSYLLEETDAVQGGASALYEKSLVLEPRNPTFRDRMEQRKGSKQSPRFTASGDLSFAMKNSKGQRGSLAASGDISYSVMQQQQPPPKSPPAGRSSRVTPSDLLASATSTIVSLDKLSK